MTARPEIAEWLPNLLEPAAHSEPLIRGRRLGDILRALRTLSDENITRIEQHHKQFGLRFGEAAVALKLADAVDIDWALSQQYHYAWVRDGAQLQDRALVMAHEPFCRQAEAFRDLRAQLMADARLAGLPVAVVGLEPGAGRSYTAANLAIAYSQLGARTLLIDADLRNPRQHRLFGISRAVGLTELLAERGLPGVVQHLPALPHLHLMVAGSVPPNPMELLQGANFRRLLSEVTATFEYVVIDTPPAQASADARVVAAASGAAVLVGRRHHSPLKALQQLVAGVVQTGAVVAGAVMSEY